MLGQPHKTHKNYFQAQYFHLKNDGQKLRLMYTQINDSQNRT